MKKYILVIPARYKSSRFPGKPLFKFFDKSMIQLVWENCTKVVNANDVYVATDDIRIKNHCLQNNIQVIMTSANCKTGTDRVYEVSKIVKSKIYINVQGDEPLLKPIMIKNFINFALKNKNNIVNAMTNITNIQEYESKNIPKLICTPENFLIYMSRAPIPGSKNKKFLKTKKQVCIYSFPYDKLRKFGSQKTKTPLEKIEDIEILRFIELGEKIKMFNVSKGTIAVDTPDDAKKVFKLLK